MINREQATKVFNLIEPFFVRPVMCGWYRRGLEEGKQIECVCSFPLHDISPSTGLDIKLGDRKTKRVRGFSLIIEGVQWNFYPTIDESFGAAILGMTGNFLFTKIIRKRAKELDYRLNQYGLMAGRDIVAGRTEHQILYMLGIEYVKPTDRNVVGGYKLPIIKEEG